MATKAQPDAAPVFPEAISQVRDKALETVSALAEANQRVAGTLIELSSAAARESFQAYVDIQSAALDAVRQSPAAALFSRQGIEELQQDPFAWYRKGLLEATGATQRMARLVEANAQIAARGAGRLEASAEQTTREIGEAVKSCVSRVKDIQGIR